MRSIRWLAITAMLAALGGCQGTGTTGCFGMEPGDCGGFPANVISQVGTVIDPITGE